MLKKPEGKGLAGGVTVSNEDQIKPYLNFIIREHKKLNSNLKLLGHYVGIKKELHHKSLDRNYLYHINKITDRQWTVLLGKFTLCFSMAPEFFRRVYNRNPSKNVKSSVNNSLKHLIAPTEWQSIV